ncbi:MAG TPA: prephenate dehydratase [Solirubrobacteraceae bacterium]|nr:prephenate dehydratase [Solirubrobacteraceae bacterium]
MRVGYLGPEGTFTEQAAQRVDGERVPFATVHDVVEAVSSGAVERGVVPIENSLEGAVNATLDALAVDFPGVAIVGESVLAVHQALIAREALELSAITLVASHPQGLAQCARFLREQLPAAQLAAATSTAEAVRNVVASFEPHAAIAPARAAQVHGGVVLRERIEDDPDNATRFVVLALASPEPPTGAGPFKTSVLFAGAGDSSPGWLVRCLSEFAFRGVNLTKIESRPRRRQLGHYLFLVDLEGAAHDAAAADAIEGLRKHCEEVRVLGTYEAAPGVSLD